MIALRIDYRLAARVDPSDIVQDALTTAHQRLPEYFANPKMAFYSWLRRIARDRLTDAYRMHLGAERRSVLRESPALLENNNDSYADLARVVAASSISPNRRAMQAELEAHIVDALHRLRPHDRELLVLRYMEQLGVPEIAGILGVSHTVVTSRHIRALQRLRRLVRSDF